MPFLPPNQQHQSTEGTWTSKHGTITMSIFGYADMYKTGAILRQPTWRTQSMTYRSYAMRVSRGVNQFGWHSQCASRNTITSPLEYRAPFVRVPIKPSRSVLRYSFTFPLNCFTYSSSCDFKFATNQSTHNCLTTIPVHFINAQYLSN